MIARMLAALLALVSLGAAAPARAADPPPLRPAGVDGLLGNETLSDRRTVTRWANANRRAPVRAEPGERNPRVGTLHWNTEDGLPEVYLVLESRLTEDERVWLRVGVPRRSGTIFGWVREEDLSSLREVETHLLIDRKKLTATLREYGKVIWRARIGVGKDKTRTPRGEHWIRERLRGLRSDPFYGPWAFGTSAYSSVSDWPGVPVVGLHGTNMPELIPGRPSNGCVRIRNRKIRQLARLLPIGTPVTVQ